MIYVFVFQLYSIRLCINCICLYSFCSLFIFIDFVSALQQNINNLKAHYRHSLAYKALKDWSNAERVAKEGRKQALEINKTKEVVLNKFLIIYI